MQKICASCGNEFVLRTTHPQEQYCDKTCKKRAQNQRHYQTYRDQIAYRNKIHQRAKRATIFNDGYVYFIVCVHDNMVKIGYSTNPIKRLNSLQTSNYHDLELLGYIPGDIRDEKTLQHHFSAYHHRGEWFYYVAECVNMIGSILSNDTQ